jgi:arylsulfatase A-like enzyme
LVKWDPLVLVASGLALMGFLSVGYVLRPGGGSLGEPVSRPPNVLVIDIDTLSYDHVGVQKNGVTTTPHIDALAERGVRFTHAFSHSGWTLPALSASFSGRLSVPVRMEGGGNSWRQPGTRDFAEILSYYGYHNTAFWGSTLMREMASSISSGFASHSASRSADQAMSTPSSAGFSPPTQQVLDFLGGAPQEPFLAFVHDIDLHRALAFDTVDADDPLADASAWAGGQQYLDIYRTLAAEKGAAEAQVAIIEHYDRMLSKYDERVGQMLTALDKAGLTDHTVIVVTSDHGDDFFLHADVDHGLLYDSTTRVPLILVDPRASAKGVVVDDVVQSVDLAPTLLELAGIQPDAQMDGRSLSSFLGYRAAKYTSRPVFSLSDACHASWREGGLKLILRDHAAGRVAWHPATEDPAQVLSVLPFLDARQLTDVTLPLCTSLQRGGQGAAVSVGERAFLELYDLEADPDEQRSIAADRPDDVARLLRKLLATLNTYSGAQSAIGGSTGTPYTSEQVQAMKAQGYWGFVAPPDAAGVNPQ